LNTFVESSKIVYLVYLLHHALFFCLFNLVIILGTIDDPFEVNQLFLHENPDLANFTNTPILCFTKNKWSTQLFVSLCITLAFFFFVGNTLLYIVYLNIRMTRRQSSINATSKMQLMLFKGLPLFSMISGKFQLLIL
jgi:hypothetical protein